MWIHGKFNSLNPFAYVQTTLLAVLSGSCKVDRVSIQAVGISFVSPIWRVVIQRNSLSAGSHIYIYIYIIIIIIMSRRLRGYPWPSLAISPYHSSPPAGLQDYNPCPHIAAVCKFVLVVPLLHIHEWGSTGVHRLWARPCFSSSVLRVWFVELV